MQDARTTTRKSLEDFAAAWLAGDEGAVTRCCSPRVRWWTPLADDTDPGPAAVSAALAAVLATAPRPIEVTALAVNEDGSRGVLEFRSPAGAPTGAATLVTSVVSVSAGRITEGRTYANLELPTVPTPRNA